MNQYDSQVLRELATRAGYEVVEDPAQAALIVLDSCTVTAQADTDVRRLLRRFRRLNPESKIALTGCLPTGAEALPADLVLSSAEKFTLFDRLSDSRSSSRGASRVGGANSRHWPLAIQTFSRHQRPILKVQDGCRFSCAFCIVPSHRGTCVSRPPDEALEEARGLAANGAREIVLAGVQLSSYGIDRGLGIRQARLAPLVAAILKVPGVSRVRLSSYGVSDFEKGLLDLVGEDSGLCPHFHLPLQSGDEGVLRSMKRPYTLDGFARVLERIRRIAPEAGITTDLIAGFPGETEAAFRNTLRRAREFGFQDLHAFPYSERPGTPAAGLPGKIPPGRIRERMARLLSLKRELLEAAQARATGQVFRVVVEAPSGGLSGATLPSGLRVVFPREEGLEGREVRIRVQGIRKGQMQARRVE